MLRGPHPSHQPGLSGLPAASRCPATSPARPDSLPLPAALHPPTPNALTSWECWGPAGPGPGAEHRPPSCRLGPGSWGQFPPTRSQRGSPRPGCGRTVAGPAAPLPGDRAGSGWGPRVSCGGMLGSDTLVSTESTAGTLVRLGPGSPAGPESAPSMDGRDRGVWFLGHARASVGLPSPGVCPGTWGRGGPVDGQRDSRALGVPHHLR